MESCVGMEVETFGDEASVETAIEKRNRAKEMSIFAGGGLRVKDG